MTGYGEELGSFRGRRVNLHVEARPSFNDVEEFSVSLFFDTEQGRGEEVVRIDSADHHGGFRIHIHRLYRRDEAVEEFDGDIWTAVDYLKENWRRFARSFLS
ncbi:MAG: hypothetical protein MAG715_01288 [Methanonatronarchaeales archaeon]|nr:hypothetical protein [Methanonatronarchaeales archaeon]